LGRFDPHILIIDENVTRTAILEDGLREAGYARISLIADRVDLLRRIVDLDPDVIFIDLENPNRDVLEQMFQVSRVVRRPIAMFVDRSDAERTEAAMNAGVSAYIVDDLRRERVGPILDMTISRFKVFNQLQEELENTKRELADRKIIERAKGILMRRRNLNEDQAYAMLRKTAMDAKTRISEIARTVVRTAEPRE
jgi:two-component system, response regulator / RNA-binding antiterminator